ncbi:MAG: AAA family ATPase, partial [Microlunatus sp.]|nr:AAA family ATPase [Microlunatus sp.]
MKQLALEQELAVEQAHVDRVYARLAEATRSAQLVASEGANLYRSDRGSFVREEDGTGLYERDVFAYQAAKRLAVLDAEHEGLVFGRLDRTDGEVRYVGRIGVRDADYEPLVIDWRAPAAEPFYRATPINPMQVVRRRVLRCSGKRVVGIEDDLLDDQSDGELVVVGEGALMAALTRARGPQMRDIVATIQAEQDEAIRAPWQGFTMISGGPGTGKTVVALHRAAFLLYSHRRRFESGGVLVVGPSRVFMTYIERVLPSLGEDAVTLRSIGGVASDVIDVRGEQTDDATVATIKGSLRMVGVLKRLVHEPWQDVPLELTVTVYGHVLRLGADELARIRADILARTRLNAGREPAERALLNALWRRCPSDLDVEREEFDDRVSDSAAFAVFTNAWWPRVSATDALARLGSPSLAARMTSGSLTAEESERLSASYRDRRDVFEPTIADVALLDELVHRLGPLPEPEEREVSLFLDDDADVSEVVTTMERLAPQREIDPFATPNDTFAHILVDEAQDISPMQWRMLRRRGPSASWTIVGDPAQSSWPNPRETDKALVELIGGSPVRRFRMSTNYRSPAEVFDLAAEVVLPAYPEADLPRAVRSTGVDPDLRTTDDLASDTRRAVADLLAAVDGTVGVVAPPSQVAELWAALRRGGPDETDGPGDRVIVVTALQAKGLEYDGVLVVDPDAIVAESAGGLRTLYVALTRPTQRLVTL